MALVGLTEAVADLERARAAAAPVVRMANVATASGGEGALTLATYVLGQRFADLVAAANARLVGISDGRYELVRSAEREAVRTRRLGLAMQVLDHRTGTARDPRTLSGGETFYVSLCLALGLADVVTAEAGGIELGTLLIDEGFGALDAETLDVVLAELSRLRDGGRVVGRRLTRRRAQGRDRRADRGAAPRRTARPRSPSAPEVTTPGRGREARLSRSARSPTSGHQLQPRAASSSSTRSRSSSVRRAGGRHARRTARVAEQRVVGVLGRDEALAAGEHPLVVLDPAQQVRDHPEPDLEVRAPRTGPRRGGGGAKRCQSRAHT